MVNSALSNGRKFQDGPAIFFNRSITGHIAARIPNKPVHQIDKEMQAAQRLLV